MLLILEPNTQKEQQEKIIQRIETLGLEAHVLPGKGRFAIGITGNSSPLEPNQFSGLSGIQEYIRVSKPYKLCSRDFKEENTIVKVGEVAIGNGSCVYFAGPCSIESYDQLHTIGKEVKKAGAKILRGGAFKPRTSPYSFQGMGIEGLKILQKVGEELEMPTITEAIDLKSLELVNEYADMIQIGARNMQNFPLLKEAGKLSKPIFLKRGPSASLDELLCSAEYILREGNSQVVLCERGLRSFDSHTRNILDIAFVPVMKKLTHLPIIMDPSHAAGRRDIIADLAKACVAVGADGVMVEVHHKPSEALSDGPQALLPEDFKDLLAH